MATALTDEIRKSIKAQLTAKPKEKEARRSRRTTAGLWVRPFASDALGVNPEQIEEATKALRAAGVMADYDKQGRLVVSSDEQYRKAAKARGLWNGARGYGCQDSEGNRVLTGRDRERAKDEFRRAVANGDYD